MKLNSPDRQRLTKLLQLLDCSDRDVDLYLHCLASAPASIQEIARSMNVKRSTVHSAVERMIDEGLLFESRKGKRRNILAERPEYLSQLLEKKQQELELGKAHVDYLTAVLKNVRPDDRAKPTVKFYEGIEGLKKMLEETLETKTEVLVFTHVDIFSALLEPEYLESYFKRRAAKGIKTRLIFPPCSFADRIHEKSKEYLISMRLMPKGIVWKAGIFSWDNKIAIKSFSEGKITCTIIENPEIAAFYRTIIFEFCWNQTEPRELQ